MDTSVQCYHGRDSFTEVWFSQAHLFPGMAGSPWGYCGTLSAFIEGRDWLSLFAAGVQGERIEVFAVGRQLTQGFEWLLQTLLFRENLTTGQRQLKEIKSEDHGKQQILCCAEV